MRCDECVHWRKEPLTKGIGCCYRIVELIDCYQEWSTNKADYADTESHFFCSGFEPKDQYDD